MKTSSFRRNWRGGILTAVVLAASAQAQTVLVWNFGSSVGDLTASSGLPVANLTVGSIASFTGQTLTNASTSPSSAYAGSSGTFNASFAAVSGAFNSATSSAFSLTLTPAAGYQVSLSSVSFGSRSTASGPTSISLRTSADSYGADVYSTTVATTSSWALLSSGSLTSITGTALNPLNLRIYGSGGSSASSGNWRIDDLSVTVVVSAIPEPSTYAAIAGMVILGVAVIRRRRISRARG